MKHYVGEVGTAITLDTGITLTSATSLKIKYQKPDGTTGEWTGAISGTTSIRYLLQTNDISIAGRWQFQSYAVFSSGAYYGETVDITFAELFDENILCYLQTVKNMIHQTVDQTDEDALLESLIAQETKHIQNYCNRTFFYGTFTEYHDGNGTDMVFVKEFPIDAVTSLHDDTDRVFGSDTLIASADYYIKQNAGIIQLLETYASEGVANIKVIYTGGYKVIPKDLELACAQRVVASYLELKGGINVMEGETVTYKPANLRKEAELVLNLYKAMFHD
jgi:hypothetical protein